MLKRTNFNDEEARIIMKLTTTTRMIPYVWGGLCETLSHHKGP